MPARAMARTRVPRFTSGGHVVQKTAVYEEDLGLEKRVPICLLRMAMTLVVRDEEPGRRALGHWACR